MSFELKGFVRTDKGKNAAGKFRREGFIPGNLMADNGKTVSIYFSFQDLQKLITKGIRSSSIIDFTLEGGGDLEKTRVIFKEIQRDPVTDFIIHVDFYQTTPGKPLKVTVPLQTVGLAKGVKLGGAMEHYLSSVNVKTVPEALMDLMEVDISHLDVGEAIYIKDVSFPEQWEILLKGNPIICRVARSRVTQQAAAAAS